jgi:peroxiredoxin-like protein
MPEDSHHYHIEGSWTGNSENGTGKLSGSGGELALDYPVVLGGHEGRQNPEELLMQAVAGCYLLTLVSVAERRKIPISDVYVTCDGQVVRQQGGTLKFVAMQLRPRIRLGGADEAQVATARDLAHKAELYCPISNAVRGSIEITLEPEIIAE